MRTIPTELDHLKSVAAAVLSPGGILLESNAGFELLLGASRETRVGTDVARHFAKPRFEEIAAAPVKEGGELYRGTLDIRDDVGGVRTLHARVQRSASGLCLVAEYDMSSRSPARQAAPAVEREQLIVEAALTDALTGVGNRAALDQWLFREISRARRTGLALGMLVAGLDRLAGINTRHGQPAGDKVLARFGYLLRLLTRPTDLSARLDADRFVVLMPHTSLAGAAVVAERIRAALSKDGIAPLTEPATASFGVVEFRKDETAQAFLDRAGAALEQAKAAGRDKVVATPCA